jgi:PiT family inorganic phosphate transporter
MLRFHTVAILCAVFVFSAVSFQQFVTGLGLPPIPLVPVSSSQTVVGAVCGIAFARGIKGLRQIRWRELGKIAVGWVSTPISAALICYVLLFIVQNWKHCKITIPIYSNLSNHYPTKSLL